MIKGIVQNLPFAEYIKLEAEHSSGLKRMLQSPMHYRTPPTGDKDTFRSGRAVHMALTDMDRFAADFTVWTGGRRYGKTWDAFCEANASKTILTQQQFEQVIAIRKNVSRHAIASKYLKNGNPEVTLVWDDEKTKLGCKARVDWLRNDCIVDIKTTKNHSPTGFGREVATYSYHMQLAFYQEAVRAVTGETLPCKIIAIQNTDPFDVVVFDVVDAALAIGKSQYEFALEQVKQCRSTDKWPGMAPDREVPLVLPQWALPALEDGPVLTFGGVAMFADESGAANG